jgi:thioesterase domain-containing protein
LSRNVARTLGEAGVMAERKVAPVASPNAASAAPAIESGLARSTPAADELEASGFSGSADVLVRIWREALGVPDLGLDESLFDLGASSIQIAQAFYRIERELGRELPLSTIFEAGNLRAVLEVIHHPVERRSSLIAIRPRGTRPPVFVVPGVGGNVIGLSDLARLLGADQPFFGLQSRGLDGREAHTTTIEETAAVFLEDMGDAAREPCVLIGICWGAVVAHEMAQRQAAAGHPPLLLGLMDPTLVEAPVDARPIVGARAKFLGRRLALYWSEFRAARGLDRLRLLRNKVARALDVLEQGGTGEETRMELNQFRVSEANREAILRYRPQRYRGRAVLFFTADRKESEGAREREAWRALIHPESAVVYTPGNDTGDALSPENVGAFAERIRDVLEGGGVDA